MLYKYIGGTWQSQGVLGDATAAATVNSLAAPRTHLYLPGVAGNFISTPDPSQLAGATQLDVRWIEKGPATSPVGVIVGQGDGSAQSFSVWSGDGSASFGTGNAAGTPPGAWVTRAIRPTTTAVSACRVTWQSSDGRVQMFSKQTADITGMLDNTGWIQVGANGTTGTTALWNSTAPLVIGQYYPAGNPLKANMLATSVATTIDGTPFALWRADSREQQYTDRLQ